MKKQIFILVIAVFASVVNSYGQFAVKGTLPVPLTCDAAGSPVDPLNPVAGRPYTYDAIISPTGGTAYWYATKAQTFMTAGKRVVGIEIPADGTAIATGATNYMSSAAAPTSPTSTTVTWTSAGLAGIDKTNNPLFMVVEYTGPTCSNNMKVMQIIPKFVFTVDITNMTHVTTATPTPSSLAFGALESQCFDVVQSSSWDKATGNILIDYGTNVLYFEVIAANFTDSYNPVLQLTGVTGTQTASIDWGYTPTTITTNLVTDAPSGAAIQPAAFNVKVDPTVTSTKDGVSIYVKVTIKNHGFEGTTPEPITLAVEATDNVAPTPNKDIEPDCLTYVDFGDKALQTLDARPAVTEGTIQLKQIP